MKRLLTHILAILLLLPSVASAQALTEARVKELVYEAIRENPEIVLEAIAILRQRDAEAQAKKTADVLESERDALEHDPNAPVLGNPDGDVTIVEFFDYNCPYCKRVTPIVEKLLKEDGNIRLVHREWPILSQGSVFAAKAALAARAQGKYPEFYREMMALKGRADEGSVMRVAKRLGLDINKLRADMESGAVQAHIDESMRLSRALGINGTPAFVIGKTVVPGFIDREKFDELIGNVRKGG